MLKSLPIKFMQSLAQTVSLLCVSILLIFLSAMVLFIALKGSEYFIPKSAYKVSISFSDESQSVAYEVSSLSAAELALQYEKRYKEQFLAHPQSRPVLTVQLAEQVYQVVTKSGKTHFGEFYALIGPRKDAGNAITQDTAQSSESQGVLPLKELNNLLNTVALLQNNLSQIQQGKLQAIHQNIANLDKSGVSADTPARSALMLEFEKWQGYANELERQIAQYVIVFKQANEELITISLHQLDRLTQPNQLSFVDKLNYSLDKIWQFLSDNPKQASTTGGVFPAIFGTLLMVILMAVVVAPFGIIAAIYLHEYAPNNRTTQLIRIGISNMAAVPSIVYGVFGLGFFVYFLGGSIDALFYPQTLPAPTFGTPGLLWASLTMGLLTLPVVIVSAEEGLQRVPRGLRAGSYALGATKFETIVRVVIPMASPGMLTGVILAVARAAGEVAPLILVGAVKFAPNLPIDGEYPFVHLERQFMHLGVFIYDGAFHNQTQTQSASLMFATCMLLLIIVFLLNVSAIMFRHKLRNKYERL
ncbi:phosphate ABC transporter permease PstA [Ningiella sp. W23]|uniref:phosphate ABC transporter permease PstA n=1 Tax=Ningiella sp. W23 TaxID=3023715 RepID=UPI0039F5FA29